MYHGSGRLATQSLWSPARAWRRRDRRGEAGVLGNPRPLALMRSAVDHERRIPGQDAAQGASRRITAGCESQLEAWESQCTPTSDSSADVITL